MNYGHGGIWHYIYFQQHESNTVSYILVFGVLQTQMTLSMVVLSCLFVGHEYPFSFVLLRMSLKWVLNERVGNPGLLAGMK